MKVVYAAIFALLIPTTVNAQNIIQDSIFGDNVIQENNYYSRPKVVKKVVRSPQKNVYNTYNIYENTTVAPPPVTVVTPPPVTVVTPPVAIVRPVPVPVPVVPYYAPVPVPVYGGYYGYY